MIGLMLAVWLAWQTVSPEALQHLQTGEGADKQRNFTVAITEFKKVTELEPQLAEGFVHLGQADPLGPVLTRNHHCVGTGG